MLLTTKKTPIGAKVAALLAGTVMMTGNVMADTFISELHYDNASTDTGEAIEIQGLAGTDLSGWSIALYNGNNGSLYNTTALSGVLADDCDGEGVTVVNYATNGIQNGAPDGIALVNSDDEIVEFISYEGEFTASNGIASGLSSVDIDVRETSSTPAGHSLKRIEGTWQAPSENTFGQCVNSGSDSGTDEPGEGNGEPTEPEAPSLSFVHDIQGADNNIAITGDVMVEAIVVADYQADNQLSGFFIQEEDADADADLLTSEGIFVYCPSCSTDISVGDRVSVIGEAGDFFDMSQISVPSAEGVVIVDTENTLPTPATVSLPVAVSASDVSGATAQINEYYERVEGMLVSFDTPMTISEYYNLGRFSEVVLTQGGRMHQFSDANEPTAEGYVQHQIELATRRMILDDDNNQQNDALYNVTPIDMPLPGFSVDNYFRGGDQINNLVGVMHWSWAGSGSNAWRIRPVTEVSDYEITNTNPRQSLPAMSSRNLKVASFNVLNLFTTIDDGIYICGPAASMECRGADSASEYVRQLDKIVSALCEMDADVVGLMEMENNPQASLAAVTEGLAQADCGTYDYVDTGFVGDDAIKVGIIYKPSRVRQSGEFAILDDVAFTDPQNTGQGKNRPAVAQTFWDRRGLNNFTVVVNHLKSKGSSCGTSDDDETTGQGNCNLTRTLAAEQQVEWLNSSPTGVRTQNILVIGDLNAYRKEDPIKAFENAGYVNLIADINGDEAYSYVFDGQLGYLDHALSSTAMRKHVKSVYEWHINADESNLLDYNDTVEDVAERSFEPKPSALPLYNDDAYRSSDHDPIVVEIEWQRRSRPSRPR